MRVCPDCGHIDSSYWRHSRFNRWHDFTEFANFQIIEPNLAACLKVEKVIVNKGIIYNLSKGGYVYRRYEIDGFSKENFHSTAEKRNLIKTQTKLLLVLKKGES